jgi:menaquinone-dependent protoporphyrinogen IX oxidase
MNRILITYVSHSGSTCEIANFLGNELSTRELDVDVKAISEIDDLSLYDFVIAGGLLYRFGWHPEIIRFLQKNLMVLKAKKVALFVTGLRLNITPDCESTSYPVFIDPSILKSPVGGATIEQAICPLDSFMTIKGYLRAALPAIEKIAPVSLAFFAGKLDICTLKLPEKLIMSLLMLFIGKKPGDYRNWGSIRAWVDDLSLSDFHEELQMRALLVESVYMPGNLI